MVVFNVYHLLWVFITFPFLSSSMVKWMLAFLSSQQCLAKSNKQEERASIIFLWDFRPPPQNKQVFVFYTFKFFGKRALKASLVYLFKKSDLKDSVFQCLFISHANIKLIFFFSNFRFLRYGEYTRQLSVISYFHFASIYFYFL